MEFLGDAVKDVGCIFAWLVCFLVLVDWVEFLEVEMEPFFEDAFQCFPHGVNEADGAVVGGDGVVFAWFWNHGPDGGFPSGWEVAGGNAVGVDGGEPVNGSWW